MGWAPAEISAFDLRLCRHGRADANLDPRAFAFGHATEDRHDQIVGFGIRVDRATDFGDPQLDPIVDEDGEGQTELVAVEGALRFTDDDRVEPAVGAREHVE